MYFLALLHSEAGVDDSKVCGVTWRTPRNFTALNAVIDAFSGGKADKGAGSLNKFSMKAKNI